MANICAPALIYVVFSLTQIILDTIKGLYNTALVKFIVMILITFMLNVLCHSGMSIISWIIVFVPFILMSVIVGILLYVFGLDPSSGQISFGSDKEKVNKDKEVPVEVKGGNMILSTSQ